MEAHPNRSDLEESADAVGYQHRHLVRRHIVFSMCDWLASQGIARLSALDDEGEMIWK